MPRQTHRIWAWGGAPRCGSASQGTRPRTKRVSAHEANPKKSARPGPREEVGARYMTLLPTRGSVPGPIDRVPVDVPLKHGCGASTPAGYLWRPRVATIFTYETRVLTNQFWTILPAPGIAGSTICNINVQMTRNPNKCLVKAKSRNLRVSYLDI